MTDISAEATIAEAAPAAPAETTARKGRPRPDTTIARDEQVLALIKGSANGMTRAQIADELQIPGNTVYLALYRLRKTGKVDRARNGAEHIWVALDDTAVPAT